MPVYRGGSPILSSAPDRPSQASEAGSHPPFRDGSPYNPADLSVSTLAPEHHWSSGARGGGWVLPPPRRRPPGPPPRVPRDPGPVPPGVPRRLHRLLGRAGEAEDAVGHAALHRGDLPHRGEAPRRGPAADRLAPDHAYLSQT